jgi:hypothetical protein
MPADVAIIDQPSRARPVAPWRHTVILAAFFLLLALAGAVFQQRAGGQGGGALSPRTSLAPLYVSLIAAQWGLFYYVWKVGLRKAGASVRALVGGRWAKPEDVVLDAALAAGMWAIWVIVQAAWGSLSAPAHAASIKSLLPQRPVEIALWIALSVSAGFSEELVFRGYFQKQFEALTRSAWLALVLQAVLFGVSHGYQGAQACMRITAYGCLFGLVALWRRSLRPGMFAHALTDIVAGIF